MFRGLGQGDEPSQALCRLGGKKKARGVVNPGAVRG